MSRRRIKKVTTQWRVECRHNGHLIEIEVLLDDAKAALSPESAAALRAGLGTRLQQVGRFTAAAGVGGDGKPVNLPSDAHGGAVSSVPGSDATGIA